MDFNYLNIFLFLLFLILVLFLYYRYILKESENETKIIKLTKKVFLVIILTGIVHMYSITENDNIKIFLVFLLAIVINIYTVIHSVKKCDYPNLYIVNLILYTSAITAIFGGLLWYTGNNNLFGFMMNYDVKQISPVSLYIAHSSLVGWYTVILVVAAAFVDNVNTPQ